MGCISSKFITKSLSFREDHSNRKRGINGLTVLDELFTSDDGNSGSNDHQFFALVSKLRTGDFVPKKSLESNDKETINTWELMAGLEEQAEQKEDEKLSSVAQEIMNSKGVELDKLKRSKSCEIINLATAFGLNDDQENKGVGRSRSFHTVEEYDAMMERIMLSVHNDENDQYMNNDVAKFQETDQSISSEPDIKEVIPSVSSQSINTDGGQETDTYDAGLKRKALSKGLSLQIPSAAEFRKTGSLKDWLQNGGNAGSPGEYVTPKFGNYNKPKSKLSEEYRDDSIFNPELVAAFEEFLERLEVEENSVLEQIEGNRNEITATE
ncbi:hypothetical protein DCAR_0626583 [Daucus carota subsp. sativus]|uniref:Uncharacterized protein n=1 Tax=Daucus carota subsp. sativus TaxID=79200 RepID=A0A164X565_DAUCS|nr:PREDICTED: uncharacterized protein LOC108227569 [Daucus carota subsp. sativus]WOH07154.1 hypothetical protein DCAR_0626583 [Daucus carota subsp. sativus]